MKDYKVANRRYYERFEQAFNLEHKITIGTSKSGFHTHNQCELLLTLSDNTFCDIGNGKQELKKDTLMLFNSLDLHYFGTLNPNDENNRYVLYFEPSYVDYLSTSTVNLLDCFIFRPNENSHILELSQESSVAIQNQMDKIIELQKLSEKECYGKELHIQLLLADILLNVNTLYRQKHNIIDRINNENYRYVYSIIEFIHQNYTMELSLDSISRQFFINKFTLCETFKQVKGVSLNQYIINCRLNKAKELLLNGYSVEQVCGDAGFNNLSHFSRIFKDKIGQSPKQFQKSEKKNYSIH